MTIRQILNQAKDLELDFLSLRRLLCYVLNVDNAYIISNIDKELEEKDYALYNKYLLELKNGRPLQYITNTQEFMGMNFYVDENVLIPQPDTEVLVEQTLTKIKECEHKDLKVLDLCTGSGAIAISIKKYLLDNGILENVKIYASDISEKALEVARRNEQNLLDNLNRINFIQSDMFENINTKFDIIVSNPPYIKKSLIKTLSKNVQNEPIIALDGGEDGLDFYRQIRKNVTNYLKEDGCILLEIGYDQKNDVMKLFENSICIKDYASNDRVIIWNN